MIWPDGPLPPLPASAVYDPNLPTNCGHEWAELTGEHHRNHHECDEPIGHLDDHVCGTCGRSWANNEPWRGN